MTVKLRYHKNFPFGFLLQSTITTAVNKHLLFFSLLFPPDGSWLNISFQCNFKFQNVNTTIAYLKATLTFMGPLSWWRFVLYECNYLVYFLISLHIINVLIRSKALHLLPLFVSTFLDSFVGPGYCQVDWGHWATVKLHTSHCTGNYFGARGKLKYSVRAYSTSSQ